MKNKICFVVQRYGLEVNGGAELLTRQFAEKMSKTFDIDVLTTQAIDYQTWRNEYKETETVINGVKILRFPVIEERNLRKFAWVNREGRLYDMSPKNEQAWLEAQGPNVPALIEYIRNNRSKYDLFVFFTYLYYPTVMGIREVPEKSIIIPFAHDEPYIRMKQFKDGFTKVQGICFETEEERKLIRERYENYNIPYTMLGAGVDVPEKVDGERFKKKYNLDKYIIYVGRIEGGKNCPEMFDYFLRFKKTYKSDVKLVLLGKAACKIPKSDDIIPLGFVSDQDKFDGITGSQFLLLPSMFESLSLVVLEAFRLKVPVLVNEKSEVLKGHCLRSNGGYFYDGYYAFSGKTIQLLNHPSLQRELGENGYKYVFENYRWDIICQKMKNFFEMIIERTGGKT